MQDLPEEPMSLTPLADLRAEVEKSYEAKRTRIASLPSQMVASLMDLTVPIDQMVVPIQAADRNYGGRRTLYEQFRKQLKAVLPRASSEVLTRVLQYPIACPTSRSSLARYVLIVCLDAQRDPEIVQEVLRIYPIHHLTLGDHPDVMAGAIDHVVKKRRPDLLIALMDPETGLHLPREYVMPHALRSRENGPQEGLFDTWLQEYLETLATEALQSPADSLLHVEMDKFVRNACFYGNEDDIPWLFRVADRYLGNLFQGDCDDPSRLPLFRRGYLMQIFLDEELEASRVSRWIIAKRVPAYPGQWEELIKSLLPRRRNTEVSQIIEAGLAGEIVVDGIGLLAMIVRRSYTNGIDRMLFLAAQIDPTACNYLRNNLSALFQMKSKNCNAADAYDLLEYYTSIKCPCDQIYRVTQPIPNRSPLHSGPLPIQAKDHEILRILVKRYPSIPNDQSLNRTTEQDYFATLIGVIAEYTRTHDLPIHYYLVGTVVIMIRNPCFQADPHYPILQNRNRDLDHLLAFRCNEIDVVAIHLERTAITLEQGIAACQEIMAKGPSRGN